MTTSVKVIHGANDGIFDLPDGTTVFNVGQHLADAFNIPAEAIAFVNGELVKASYRLMPNDTLEFVKQRGKKAALDPDERAQLDRIEAMLNRLFAKPADHGSPGRREKIREIAVYINQLRQKGLTWKEIFKACQQHWPDDDRVRNVDQLRATHRRFFGRKSN